MSNKPHCAIIGAGLVGSLFAIIMKRRGHDVTLYEKRSDMRLEGAESGRSINLVITEKGIEPLRKLELWEAVKKITVPVSGRMMHSMEGELTYQPYGIDESHVNYSVSRSGLNIFLMNQAEREGVKIVFDHALEEVNFKKNLLQFNHLGKTVTAEAAIIVGADGAGSATRRELLRVTDGTESIQMIEADYKELLMPAADNGDYPIEKNALHIWPRGNHMLMALPNLNGSFTMTLYLNNDNSEVSFNKIKTTEDLEDFFKKFYPDAINLMPEYQKDFFENPQGKLGVVRCGPWNYQDRAILIGDAAHAIVPFFGQGMNCGFEDCFHLAQFMGEEKDLNSAFKRYYEYMKPNADAIADMALENFVEMREKVGDEQFLLKKRVEKLIEKKYPHYVSRYSLVVHTLTPYKEAQDIGKIQDQMLNDLCSDISSEEQLDWNKVDQKLKEYFPK